MDPITHILGDSATSKLTRHKASISDRLVHCIGCGVEGWGVFVGLMFSEGMKTGVGVRSGGVDCFVIGYSEKLEIEVGRGAP